MIRKIFIKKSFFSGFSLLEFTVVLAIFGIMSLIAVFNYRDFQSDAALKNLTYDVALSIRQAQTFGVSASDVDNPLTETTTSPADDKSIHGIYFSDDRTFILFLDVDRNTFYSSIEDEIVETRKIAAGGTIADTCVGASDVSCTSIGTSGLIITFERPFSDAIIRNNTDDPLDPTYAYTRIDLQTSLNLSSQKSVEVWASGAIDVFNN